MADETDLDLLKDRHKKAGATEPTVRTNGAGGNFFQVPGQTVTVAPLLLKAPHSGCMIVDVYFDPEGTPRLRAALYVGLIDVSSYTVRDPTSTWLVDLPDGVFTERSKIRDAITTFLDSGGGKPPGPPEW